MGIGSAVEPGRSASVPRERRYLVVANLTVCGEELLDTLRSCILEGPASLHVVVPASPPLDSFVWNEEEAYAAARRRLSDALRCFAALGVSVDGEIGDMNPVDAVADALRGRDFDEIVLSTLPPGVSRWLRKDLATRMMRRFGLPVRLVTAAAEPPGVELARPAALA